jgi:hypothetical protein
MEGYKRTTTTVRKDAGGKVLEINEVTETFTPIYVSENTKPEESETSETANPDYGDVDGDTSHWTGQTPQVDVNSFLSDITDMAQALLNDLNRGRKKP